MIWRRIGIGAALVAMTTVATLVTEAGGSRSTSMAQAARASSATETSAGAQSSSATQASAAVTGPRLTRVRLRTGVELEVAQTGPADGEPVLFLHGYTDSWYSFTRVLEQLPPGIHAIVPSQRGHGDSQRPDCCYDVADFAADAVALLDALGIDDANIVGHSNGSFYAQRVAIEYPERVKKLVLIGSGAKAAVDPILEIYDAAKRLSDPVDPAFVREFQATASSSSLPAEFIDRVVAESMKLPARVWQDVMAALVSDATKHDLTRIEAPTLVAWGALDPLWVRADQQALLRAVPHARFIEYTGIGHAPHWDEPARFVADVIAFLGAGPAPRGYSQARRASSREHVGKEDPRAGHGSDQ